MKVYLQQQSMVIEHKSQRSEDLFNAMGSMCDAVLYIGVQNCGSVQPVVVVERTVFYRERAADMYSAFLNAFGQSAGTVVIMVASFANTVYERLLLEVDDLLVAQGGDNARMLAAGAGQMVVGSVAPNLFQGCHPTLPPNLLGKSAVCRCHRKQLAKPWRRWWPLVALLINWRGSRSLEIQVL